MQSSNKVISMLLWSTPWDFISLYLNPLHGRCFHQLKGPSFLHMKTFGRFYLIFNIFVLSFFIIELKHLLWKYKLNMLLNQGNPNWKNVTHIRNIKRKELTHALAQVHSLIFSWCSRPRKFQLKNKKKVVGALHLVLLNNLG